MSKLNLVVLWTLLYLNKINGQTELPQGNQLCDRPCNPDTEPLICHYNFIISYTRTLNPKYCGDCPIVREDCYKRGCAVADGHLRPIYLTNDQFPGPEIRVCEDDIVVVNVTNELLSGESITIHWHGIHQKLTPFMDGVPMITQCGIEPGTTYEYSFEASPAGTHFWHAHASILRDQGIAGALIVRAKHEKTSGPTWQLFENDQNAAILVQDWSPTHYPAYFIREPNPYLSIVVNGRQGGIGNDRSPPSYFIFHPLSQKPFFRIINNGFLYCPLSLEIEGHRITLIRNDGHPFEPVTVDKLYMFASERYDIFAEIENAQSLTESNKVFRMIWEGSGLCVKNGIVSRAISYLIYTTKEGEDPSLSITEVLELIETDEISRENSQEQLSINDKAISNIKINNTLTVFNPIHKFDLCQSESINCLFTSDLRAIPTSHQSRDLMGTNVRKLYLFVDSAIGNELPNINNISFHHPSFPLLTQYPDIPKKEFCNLESNPECGSDQICHCTHLYEIEQDNVVELIISDEGRNRKRDTHTFHLHGYSFAILGQGRISHNVTIHQIKELDAQNLLLRNFDRPVFKDTVTIPEGGYVIVRFKADNPGFWILHCHLAFHVLGGMALVFKVGPYEGMIPPKNYEFPKCGSWRPNSIF